MSWYEAGAGYLPADYWVVTLAIDPSASRTLYAGTDGVGIYKSTDAGVTWATAGLSDGQVTALAINPVTPSTLYAGTEGGGVFKSTNAAVTWSAFNNGLPNMPSIFALVIDPITPSRLFAATADGVFLLQQVAAVCAGDCGGTHAVGVNDVITLVNIALGNAQPAACSDGGLPLGGEVDVSVIIQAVNSALHGCS